MAFRYKQILFFFRFFSFFFLEERGKAKKGVFVGLLRLLRAGEEGAWGDLPEAREGNVQWPAPLKACPLFL